MQTRPRPAQAAAVGVASTVLAGFAAYGLVVILELVLAQGRPPEFLPPPGDWRMRLALLVLAVVSGVFIALKFHRGAEWRWQADESRSFVRGLVAFTALAVGVAVVSTVASHISLERSYLHSVPAGTASDTALLEAGHDACDWLGARHWGGPSMPRRSYMTDVPTPIGHPTSMVIRSTGRLASLFHYYLVAQPPSAMTRLEDRISLLAWYKMCPFQQWVHRPVGGSGD
jgi:hypothetical protein